MAEIVIADIDVYDPALKGLRTLRYATQGYITGNALTEPVVDSRFTNTRSSSGTRINSAGVLENMAANVSRIDHDPVTKACLGLLIEEQRTNSVRNNTMVGAVSGSPGTLPTNWGQFIAPAGITRSVVATGSSGGINYVDIRFSGTASSAGEMTAYWEQASSLLFAAGSTVTNSVYLALVGGSLTNISGVALRTISYNGAAFVSEGNIACTLSSSLQRFSHTYTTAVGSDRILATISPTAAGAGAVDITIRIGLPQLEQGGFATSAILTTGATATRSHEWLSMTPADTVANWNLGFEGTFLVEAVSHETLPAGSFGASLGVYVSANKRYTVYLNPANDVGWFINDAGVTQCNLSAGTITPGTAYRIATAWKVNDFAACLNGGTVQTDNSGSVPFDYSNFSVKVGSADAATSPGRQHIRRIIYYTSRLPNSTLIELSSGVNVPNQNVTTPYNLRQFFNFDFLSGQGAYYEGRVQQPASVQRWLFAQNSTMGRSQIGFGALVLVNNDGGLDSLNSYSFAGRSITIRLGEVLQNSNGVATWTTVLKGTMEQADFTWQRVTIRVRDRQQDLAFPLQQTRYGGTNVLPAGLDGVDTDIKGKPKPLVFGQVFNAPITLVNSTRLIYEAHSGSALQTVDAVYDRGAPLTAGAAYASQVDMETTAPAANQYRVWNSAAGCYIRLGSNPAGTVTADLTQGAASANRTCAKLLQAILLRAGIAAADISSADITALDILAPQALGLFASTYADMSALEACDIIANSVGAYLSSDATGVFRMGQINNPASGTSIGTITAADVLAIDRVSSRDPGVGIPSWKVKVAYQRLWYVQDDTTANVTAARKGYLANEYRRVEDVNTLVKTANITSPEIEFLTTMVSASDAATFAADRRSLYGPYGFNRDMLFVRVRVSPSLAAILDLGKIITLSTPRYYGTAGKKFVIIGLKTDMRGRKFDLTLWG